MTRIESTVDVTYVMEIKIQEVIRYVETTPASLGNRAVDVEKRAINEVAHYVVKEKIMKVLLDKGQKLLELSGE